jgi:hypothetical protein
LDKCLTVDDFTRYGILIIRSYIAVYYLIATRGLRLGVGCWNANVWPNNFSLPT